MGRPINNRYLGKNAPHQIQATIWGTNDTGATAGYLAAQNSPRRYRTTTVNGTSLTTLTNGPSNVTVPGVMSVSVFPVGTEPTSPATANATLGVTGAPTVVAGGLGYAVGDHITLVGGTANSAANLSVATIGSGGVILTVSAPGQSAGQQQYSALPANIAAINTSNATGNGQGAIVSAVFGLDTSYVITGGAGYTDAVVVYEPSLTAPTITQPTVTGGAVTTGPITITGKGSFNVIPTVTVEEQAGTTEYVSYMQSMNYLETFQGHRYRWLYKGQPIPSDWAALGVNIAYLNTL